MEFRNARHTNNLQAITDFYTSIMGFQVLFSFENHNGYNGVFLGIPGLDWHLEFTSSGDKAHHSFDQEDILVFYPTEKIVYDKIVERIYQNNLDVLKAKNPFWDDNGIMIQDPDGFRVIVSHMKAS